MRPDGSFADIPDEVRRRVAAGERVALLLLDALGLRFLLRHDDHPLLERLQITPLRTQFPSTTTAHVTTVHSGLPVQDHGLYEWNVLEPDLDRIICPLRFTLAESKVSGELEGRLDPAALLPGPTLYESLGVPCFVLQPEAIADSVFTRLATRGARVHAFDGPVDGVQALADLMGAVDGPAYALLYWDEIDRAGHERGPGSPEFHAAARGGAGRGPGAAGGPGRRHRAPHRRPRPGGGVARARGLPGRVVARAAGDAVARAAGRFLTRRLPARAL